jgi:hypothetical protein
MAQTVSQPRPTAAEQARIFHRGYMRHVALCDACIGVLCPTGRDLEIDADAAGWRAAEPVPAEALVVSGGIVHWTRAA